MNDFSEWSEDILRSVRQAAVRSHKAQGGYVELDDLQQYAYLWILENSEKVDGWVENDIGLLNHALFQALHRWTMKERYRKDGTKAQDYYTYALPVIEDILTEIFNQEYAFGASPSDMGHTRSTKAISEGGERLAMIADVSAGLAVCEPSERVLLERRYGSNPDTLEQIAGDLDVSDTTVGRMVVRALRKIAARLGSEPVKPRRAISNAHAQHITRSQEDQ